MPLVQSCMTTPDCSVEAATAAISEPQDTGGSSCRCAGLGCLKATVCLPLRLGGTPGSEVTPPELGAAGFRVVSGWSGLLKKRPAAASAKELVLSDWRRSSDQKILSYFQLYH